MSLLQSGHILTRSGKNRKQNQNIGRRHADGATDVELLTALSGGQPVRIERLLALNLNS